MHLPNVIGIDLGGTNVRAGLIENNKLTNIVSERINSNGSVEEVMQQLYLVVDKLINKSVAGIGIGVPSVVDLEQGIVYDVQNIPSWKEVHLKKWMEERYHIPVVVNNDANCFALGEYYFGKGKNTDTMIGLIIGTGLGAGIIINHKLYAGRNCGAGEFGMVNYLDKYFEYYSCGQFFDNVHHVSGEEVFRKAQSGDKSSIALYREMGTHLGNAIKMILYTYDPPLIIFGGSVSQAFDYFKDNMWEQIKAFVFPKSLENFRIEISDLKHSGVLGAAALYYDWVRK